MATNIIATPDNEGLTRVNNIGFTSYSARKFEPQTQNTFAFEFFFDAAQVAYIASFVNEKLGGNDITGAEPISTSLDTGLQQINEILNMSMQQLGSPTKTIGQVIIDFFNSQIKFAGKPTYSNANITLNTLIGLGTKNVLAAWSDLCLNDRDLRGGWARTERGYETKVSLTGDPKVDMDRLFSHTGYKVDGRLLECARDGTVVNSWDYIGMWVSTFTPGNYNMAGSSSASQVSATITVDRIVQGGIKVTSELSRPSGFSGALT